MDAEHTAPARKWKGKTHKAKEGTLNGMKKRLRTIERKLKRTTEMPATIKNDLQREMGSLKASIASIENKRKRSNMIKKYHMVRFFERQKATRKLKQARKALAESPDDEKIKREIYTYEVDLEYTQYFPFLERYISLYAKKGEDEKTAGVPVGHEPVPEVPGLLRPPQWRVVAQAMKMGRVALERLRDRASEDVDPLKEAEYSVEEKKSKKDKKDKKNRKQKKEEEEAVQEKENDSDSDGGFFE
ncbi:hypothetical protein TD95_001896 [Thielaviopsis punctulata]|uniref:rRNA-processing protein EFG1 n=1 Tax=Thielaviopsis punctulata TaxID=72032 RepID=A0A0F4ZI75_9PEZI|nr:hypothetical protein TD95_001896 [Thielaviopsis punctulata]